jgi:hypothetical protein
VEYHRQKIELEDLRSRIEILSIKLKQREKSNDKHSIYLTEKGINNNMVSTNEVAKTN